MLEVRYGTAAKSHENTFFRRFAQSVKSYFDSHGMNGLLLGFPICLVREDLQIDALIITEKTMIIIDFKDYAGTLTLPEEADFKKGTWRMSDGLTVKGGSSPNPFYQLGLQRERLSGILRMTCKNLTKFNPKHISTLVCFTEPVAIDGSIPGKFKLSFFIANSESYLEKIFDIINVEEESCDLLNAEFLAYFNGKLFGSSPYDCFIVPVICEEESRETNVSSVEDSETIHASDTWDQIEHFMRSEDDVLVITGAIGSGKHRLAERMREIAYSAGFTSARLFALSNRVKNNLLASIEEVESLYATIYDFSKKEYDEQSGRELVPLASFAPTDAFGDLEPQEADEDLKSVFIVYESQMVTNTYRDDGTVRFGSGGLLNDILNYLDIPTSKENKVVFIGDRFQLGFGSWGQSSLNPVAYRDGISVSAIELPDSENPNGIASVCLDIAEHIRSDSFSELVIAPNEMIGFARRQSERALVEEVAGSWSTHKIIAYSNRRSHDLNSYIKRNVIRNGMQLAAGDVVIFNNQVVAYPSSVSDSGQVLAFEASEPVRIENGEFGVIQRVCGTTLSHTRSFEGLSEPVVLSLVRAEVKLRTGVIVTLEVLEEYLRSESAALSEYEERAIQILLRELFATAERDCPFAPGDPDFDEMIKTGDYFRTEDGRYRDKGDARRLTVYEKRHRERISKRLATDQSSEYFRWQNAARIKYGWCMTVHKAMSYKWPHVVFATSYDQGRNNRDYFKFIYTGISRATEDVALVKWKNLSPFSETVFVRKAISAGKRKRFVLARAKDCAPVELVRQVLERMLGNDIEIVSIDSKSYLEIVRVQQGESRASIGFDYNGKGEILSPRLLNGEKRIFDAIASRLAPDSIELAASQLGRLYEHLNRDVLGGIVVSLERSLQYQDHVILEESGTRAEARIIYDKRGSVTKFEFMFGNVDLFNSAVERIIAYYDWDSEGNEASL